MNTNKIKLLVITLIAAGNLSSCANNEDIDFSNIENLFQQPLPVIQECVQGKWKWVSVYYPSGGDLFTITSGYRMNDVYVEITEDKVVTIRSRSESPFLDDDPIFYEEFSYVWETKKTIDGYSSFVMWDIERDQGVLYFHKIQKDTLSVRRYFEIFEGSPTPQQHDTFVKYNSN